MTEPAHLPSERKGMRTGFTTGACAAAAAKAAALALTGQQPVASITIRLPVGREVTFAIARCEFSRSEASCSVIKDAGDDPDATHGAEIVARVWRAAEPAILGGIGVGRVTLPGLGLEVGGPAINQVPREMIAAAVAAITADPLVVEISVPDGERIAKKTLNARLGILGGISILGTTGIVHPYSTEAWHASVMQAIDVAAANGQRVVAITTGGRSESYCRALFPELPEVALIEMGQFAGDALIRARERGMKMVILGGMIGKLSKLADGHLNLHSSSSAVDPRFLATIAAVLDASDEVVAAVRGANSARHIQEIVLAAGLDRFFYEICRRVSTFAEAHVEGAVQVETLLFDTSGRLLGRA